MSRTLHQHNTCAMLNPQTEGGLKVVTDWLQRLESYHRNTTGSFLFLDAFLQGVLAITLSTPIWWSKVNRFPKSFPNPILYYTG